MFEIVKGGTLRNLKQFKALARRYRSLIVPSDDDADATHWWVIRQNGAEILYVGTPETFDKYTREENGGIQ